MRANRQTIGLVKAAVTVPRCLSGSPSSMRELSMKSRSVCDSQAALAGVLNDVRDDGELGEVFYARFMEPRRRSVAAMLARAADRGEIAPPTQPGVISDLLTGPLLLRTALPPIGPIDDTLVNATIEAALTACGAVDRTADRPAAKPSQR